MEHYFLSFKVKKKEVDVRTDSLVSDDISSHYHSLRAEAATLKNQLAQVNLRIGGTPYYHLPLVFLCTFVINWRGLLRCLVLALLNMCKRGEI